MVEFENVLECWRAGIKEQFYHGAILAIIVLEDYQAIKDSEHELMQALDSCQEILVWNRFKFIFK